MGEVKSAFEKAMEKVEKLEKASPQELGRMGYVPKGSALAARYLKQELPELKTALTEYEDSLRRYLIEGAEEVFLRNIALPQSDHTKQTSKRAMEGILELKRDKKRIESIFGKIEHLFGYYEQARQQAYTQAKRNFETRLEGTRRALEQQIGTKVTINAELQPQFQEEWRRTLAELNRQYEKALEEHKQEIQSIS